VSGLCRPWWAIQLCVGPDNGAASTHHSQATLGAAPKGIGDQSVNVVAITDSKIRG